jgi:hypothetical protein
MTTCSRAADSAPIERLRDRSLLWVISNVTFIEVASPEDRRNLRIDVQDAYDNWKALGELALAYFILGSTSSAANGDGYGEIRKHLLNHRLECIRSVRSTDSALTCLRGALALMAIGANPASYQPRVAELLLQSLDRPSERARWNLVEVKYFMDLLGVSNNIPGYASLCSSWPAQTALWTVEKDRDRIYELAHTIFCASDFGRLSLLPVYGARFEELCESVLRLLERAIEGRDWDLVAELILSSICIDATTAPIVETAWAKLTAIQSDRGGIPARDSGRGNLTYELCGHPRQGREFAMYFHTTVVALIAATLQLETRR